MLTSTPLMVTAVGAFALAVWRESRAGYTTLEGKLRHLPWVDVRTGKVLRAAGAPFCSARARAWRASSFGLALVFFCSWLQGLGRTCATSETPSENKFRRFRPSFREPYPRLLKALLW